MRPDDFYDLVLIHYTLFDARTKLYKGFFRTLDTADKEGDDDEPWTFVQYFKAEKDEFVYLPHSAMTTGQHTGFECEGRQFAFVGNAIEPDDFKIVWRNPIDDPAHYDRPRHPA